MSRESVMKFVLKSGRRTTAGDGHIIVYHLSSLKKICSAFRLITHPLAVLHYPELQYGIEVTVDYTSYIIPIGGSTLLTGNGMACLQHVHGNAVRPSTPLPQRANLHPPSINHPDSDIVKLLKAVD